MKIGLFTDSYYPHISGVAVSIDILYKELKKLGHDVKIITLDHENAEPNADVYRFKGQHFPMKGLKEYQFAKVTQSKIDKMEQFQFDVIHCHTEFTMGRLGRAAAKKFNIPVVHTYHTMYEDYIHFVTKAFSKPLRFASKHYSKAFANSADEVIFPTIKVRNTFDRYGYTKESHIIPTGIYLDKFQKINFNESETVRLRDSLGLKEDEIVLLFLGRLSKEKNLTALISQFSALSKQNDKVKLLIVGGGPDAEVFHNQVKELALEDSVIFTGMVPPNEVGYYYHVADVFVNFSTTETQGLTYIEALASGLPLCVKYDVNLDNVLVEHFNGISFNKDHEFISAFYQLTTNKVKFTEITNNTTKSIDKFSAKNYALNVERIYTKLNKKGL